jgi:hypothetical protein
MIVSENGYHAICCLSQKKAMDCIMGKKIHFVSMQTEEQEFYNDLLMEQQEQM